MDGIEPGCQSDFTTPVAVGGDREAVGFVPNALNQVIALRVVIEPKRFRIPADARDLNYDKFFVEGQEDISKVEDYHSHNTFRLDKEGMKQLLLKLPEIREDINQLVQ